MKVIGCEVIDAGKKFARVVLVFQDPDGRIAQVSVPLSKLKFIAINAQPAPGS